MGVPAASPRSLRALPLVWCGPLRDPSGYADEGRAFLLALERQGLAAVARELRWTDVDAGLNEAQAGAVERALARALPAEFVQVHHAVPYAAAPRNPTGSSVIRTMFEAESIPRSWLGPLLEADEVWVPTSFNVETFQRGGFPGARLHVLPETLDFELFAPGAEPLHVPGRRSFTFLSSFDFTDRKGWDVLLEAWAAAFAPDEDVCLLLKCVATRQHGMTEAGIRAALGGALAGREAAPVLTMTDVLPLGALPRLYAAADAFVLASRGEGWGRPYMEAMAMGLPTIGTRWSGNLAFMNDGNSWLVDGGVVSVPPAAQRHTGLYCDQRWFEPDPEALATTLRAVFDGREEARARAAGARAELLARFGPEPTARRLVELAESALERWRWRRSRPVACVWRGDFGRCHSLAAVNDGVVDSLEAGGAAVVRTPASAAQAPVDAVGVAQHWPPSFDPPTQGPFVLYQPWEFGRVPARWVEEIRRTVDEVWVPSESTRAAFVASGLAPELVHVVPNGVDLDRFTPGGEARPLPERPGTVFLFVGGTIHRKGIDVLLDAYARAFTAADDVLLIVKSFGAATAYRGRSTERELRHFRSSRGMPRLELLDEDVAHAALPALYRAADVVVQPYRAEGFCLPALEALACGRPVIVTAGGPTDEFVSDACAWRLPSRPAPLPAGYLPAELELAGDGFLLEPDRDALVAALREAADPALRSAKAAHARAHAERCSWQRAAAAARSRLAALAGRPPIQRLAAAVVPDRRATLFAVPAEWEARDTWAPAVLAYAHAFGPEDDTTLVLPAPDPAVATALVQAELAARSVDPAGLADIVIADGYAEPATLELAADAVIISNGHRPVRARATLPPEPDALRAFAGAR